MEKFRAGYFKNQDSDKFHVCLEYSIGRGKRRESEPVIVSGEIDENNLYKELRRVEEYASKLNQVMRKELEICEKNPEKIVISYIKNINTMITTAEFYYMMAFFRASNFDITDTEEGCLLFKIQENIFNLQDKPFAEAERYIYGEIGIRDDEFEHASENLAQKALSMNQLLECYLIENYDYPLPKILFPWNGDGNGYKTMEYRAFMDKGLLLGSAFHDGRGIYADSSSLFVLENTVEAMATVICFIISLKSGIGHRRLIEIFRTQGERWISERGISISCRKYTKSQLKLLRTYNITPREVSLLKLEEYTLHTISHQNTGKIPVSYNNFNYFNINSIR